MIRKDQQVHIKPEWQDPGDEDYTWTAIEDERNGYVKCRVDGGGFPSVMEIETLMLMPTVPDVL